jgi:hypothetical protein
VPVFTSSTQAKDVFSRLFEILLSDQVFVSKMTESNLSLHLLQTKPDLELFVSPAGVFEGPPPTTAAIRMKMSCDTAHSLWLGQLLMPLAVATGRVRIKGNVAKVLEFVPILQPAFEQYPSIVAAHGIAS